MNALLSLIEKSVLATGRYTVIGKGHKQALVTFVERKSKITLIQKVENKSADSVKRAILTMLDPFKGRVHTITSDNGKEFAELTYEEVEKVARQLNNRPQKTLGFKTPNEVFYET